MMLAHNASIVGLNVDPVALYETDDRSMLVFLQTLVDRLRRTQEEDARKAP
jgi:hypothetical protein